MFGRRLVAYIIDCLILGFIYYCMNEYVLDGTVFVVQFFTYNIIALLYFTLMESSSRQATIGKSILKLKVCDMYGYRISFVRGLIRNLVRYINTLIFSIGYLPILFTKNQQGLHDMIARTLVVDEAEISDDEN